MGLEGSFAEFWQRSVISQEGPSHRQQRLLCLQALSTDFVTGLVPRFETTAERLIEAMSLRTQCDFIEDFSHPFAGCAVTALLDLPDADADWIAADAARLGLAMRLDCKEFEDEFNAACDRLSELAQDQIARARRDLHRQEEPDNFVMRLLRGMADWPVEEQALVDLIVISIFGGVDTTRAQLGFIMTLFAEHPQQWRHLRTEPELIPKAIEESLRARPTTTWSTREAIEDFEFESVKIRAGDTLHIFAHATATDPEAVGKWTFDIKADRKAHFGFGGGAHHCLGQAVARTDMAVALRCLARKVEQVEFEGEPVFEPDSGNTAPKKLPLRLTWA
jgi:cytochrome P450